MIAVTAPSSKINLPLGVPSEAIHFFLEVKCLLLLITEVPISFSSDIDIKVSCFLPSATMTSTPKSKANLEASNFVFIPPLPRIPEEL